MILPIKIYITQKEKKKNIENNAQKWHIKWIILIISIHYNVRETNNLVILKSNIKGKADEGIRSPVAWVIGKYAMHCDAMLVWSAVLIAL